MDDDATAGALVGLPASGPSADGGETVRVLSYNVRSLRDDRAALARVVRACDADLFCVQESPRFWFPRGQAAWLARAAGMVVLSGGRDASGPLLLGRLRARVLSVHDTWLPKRPGLHQRGFATAVLQVGAAAPFSLTSCHLSLDADERRAQAELLLAHLAGLPAARRHVVGGDFNETPEGPAWRALTARLTDAGAAAPWGGLLTSPARAPHQRIDAVLTDAEAVASGVPPLPERTLAAATDHRPVLAVLRLPPAT